jgi:hypothetical protein
MGEVTRFYTFYCSGFFGEFHLGTADLQIDGFGYKCSLKKPRENIYILPGYDERMVKLDLK